MEANQDNQQDNQDGGSWWCFGTEICSQRQLGKPVKESREKNKLAGFSIVYRDSLPQSSPSADSVHPESALCHWSECYEQPSRPNVGHDESNSPSFSAKTTTGYPDSSWIPDFSEPIKTQGQVLNIIRLRA